MNPGTPRVAASFRKAQSKAARAENRRLRERCSKTRVASPSPKTGGAPTPTEGQRYFDGSCDHPEHREHGLCPDPAAPAAEPGTTCSVYDSPCLDPARCAREKACTAGWVQDALPDLPRCRACGGLLYLENDRIADGCPCNSPRGINHGLVAKNTCTCVDCDPDQTGSSRATPGKGGRGG